MEHIGNRIKELRIKSGMTQEKLAVTLGISYKSVSKWECGLTYPDIALIVPLSKIFGVSCDELLGARMKDTRLSELEKLYQEQSRVNFPFSTFEVAETAHREFPSDMKWLMRYAVDKWSIALATIPNGDEFEAVREEVIKLLDRVIGNTDDVNIKYQAVANIIGPLCGKGDKAEARRYLDLMPEPKPRVFDKDRLLMRCLDGEAQTKHKQKYLMQLLNDLVNTILWENMCIDEHTCSAAEGIIKSMIPDGNYGALHHSLCHIYFRIARYEVKSKNYDRALELLHEAVYHAKKYDGLEVQNREVYRYTAPLFDHLTIDPSEWFYSETSLLDDIKTMVTGGELVSGEVFEPLRKRDEYKELFE